MSEELIIKTAFDVTANSKEEVIEQIVDRGIEIGVVQTSSKEDVYQSFITREEQGTTGLVDGFAIPHAENMGINQAALLVYKLNNSVEWESMDGQPIQYVLGILVPSEQKGTIHLKILSEIAKMLMKKDAKEALATAESEDQVIEVINNYINVK